ncbi:MAG: hypothetical protein HY791_33165 [Deltaproteobacteria bacterium]|nr:hypothetical protein [Deltaproteobacteria bacterium]
MISYVGPPAPPEFGKRALAELQKLRSTVALRAPAESDFRSLWAEYKSILGPPKCGFCERPRDLKFELDVEHYRPKTLVTRWRAEPPIDATEPPTQVPIGPGYWWTAYAWSNWLLACSACNRLWKRNLFPLEGARIAPTEGVEASEQPLLLHPFEAFDSAEHFGWTPGGLVEPLTARARATIQTCGLNRTELVKARQTLYKRAQRLTVRMKEGLRFGRSDEIQRTGQELAESVAAEAPFAAMARWVVQDELSLDWQDL